MKRFREFETENEIFYPEDRNMNPSIAKKLRTDTPQHHIDPNGFYIKDEEGQVVDYVRYKDLYPSLMANIDCPRILKKDSEGMIYIDGDGNPINVCDLAEIPALLAKLSKIRKQVRFQMDLE